ncbi:MAG TPA: VOC family protein, partial [Chloroflexia bacterium]|nr:VOC family protein [Chloroflexia bacterium]
VHSLDDAVRDYTALGFTVVPGGEHAGGLSHNALVSFADGSYLELIAFKGGGVPEDHLFYRPGNPEGLVTYALLPDDIERTVSEARLRGLDMGAPRPGGRERPDGTRIEWKIAEPPSRDLPFLCWDVTPRDLRVPGGSATVHLNGATGLADLVVSVGNLGTSEARYEALLGEPPLDDPASDQPGCAAFRLGESAVLLTPATAESGREGPWMLSVMCEPPVPFSVTDLALTHGVRLSFVMSPLPVNSVEAEYDFVGALRCRQCGETGAYRVIEQMLLDEPGEMPEDHLMVQCERCGYEGAAAFDISSFYGR